MRRHDPFDRKSLLGSVAVHVGVLVLAVLSSMDTRRPLEFVTYQIDLVSPPPAVQAPEPQAAQEELVIERPDPRPPEPEPERPAPVLEEKPTPKPPEPKPEVKPPREEPKEPAEERKPAASVATPPPAEKPKESGEGINVRMEGLRRDYPAYYENIIVQIHRCFRWQGQGNWETTVQFTIRRDGTVTGMDFVRKSGNPEFDYGALGAVECAGKGRFGPLPEDLPWDQLPIQFNFRPSGAGGGGTSPDGAPRNDETATNR